MTKSIRVLYTLLDLLPKKAGMKIKLILNICRHDWRFFSEKAFFPFAHWFRGDLVAELETLRPQVDGRSFAAVMRFLEKVMRENAFMDALDPYRDCVFIDYSKLDKFFLMPPPRTGALDSARKKYGIETSVPEALVFQHGVAFLSPEQRRYFDGRIALDAGSCCGHCTVPLLKEYPFAEVWAFEPNAGSRRRFEENMKRNRIDPARRRQFPFGVSDREETVFYDDSGMDLGRSGRAECRIITIDGIAREQGCSDRIGLIKADVEGMGLKLLRGAVEVIRKSRPVLALAAYHCPEELFGQVHFIMENFSGYRLVFTDLPPGSGWELTLLALPAELGEIDMERFVDSFPGVS